MQRKNSKSNKESPNEFGHIWARYKPPGKGDVWIEILDSLASKSVFNPIYTQWGISDPACLVARKTSLVYNVHILSVINGIVSAVLVSGKNI